MSDLPQDVPVSPQPGFESMDHWHLRFQRSSEKGILASAKLVYMLRLIDWQEIELTKIFGAYRHAVAERRERLGDVREGVMADADIKTGEPVTPKLTPCGTHGVRVSESERDERGWQYRMFQFEILFQRDCQFTQAIERVKSIIEDLKSAKSQILMRHKDPLTGVLNRGIYERDFSTEFRDCANTGKQLSLVMIDVDHFHNLNNSYGHDIGDSVLYDIATAIDAVVDGNGKVYRYGGEEFAVLLPGISSHTAEMIAEAIRQRVARLRVHGVHVTISCGVATYPTHENGRVALFKAADSALRKAKDTGRNRTCLAA